MERFATLRKTLRVLREVPNFRIMPLVAWLDLALEDDAQWENLLIDPDLAPVPVRQCWMRSRLAGAQLEGPADEPIVTQGRLQRHREQVGVLMHLLDEVLAPTLAVFEAHDFTLLFADREGVVVAQKAGGNFAEIAQKVRLRSGAVWNEATRGTNAIGTALAEKRAVSVRGAAHFARPNHGLVCYAAPVHSPWGDVLGVLDATSFVERAAPMAAAAVLAAARALEEALRLAALARGGQRRGLVEKLLGRLRDPALLVSPQGKITHANRECLNYGLQLGHPLSLSSEVFRIQAESEQVLQASPLELQAAAEGQLRHQNFEVEPMLCDQGKTVSYLVVLKPTSPTAAPRPHQRPDAFKALQGHDPQLVGVREHARKVAPSTLPILILGETGTGKEPLARGIHAASLRAEEPFVPVNCAALTPTLLQSELFGYVGGAFTGADPEGRPGRIASAEGGTLFLDEVAEMPPALQALLLRFLEDGSYRRVGDDTLRKANVRLVCATCRDLPGLVQNGAFRADLYYRIRGVSLTLPPVRERRDLAQLSGALLAELARETKANFVPQLSSQTIEHIEGESWPGNVRELRMALHHALVMAQGARIIEPWHLPQTGRPSSQTQIPKNGPSPQPLVQTQLEAVRRALAESGGNVSQAARSLGVARSTIYRLMKKLPDNN